MSKKNIQMQVLGENGYDEIQPVPAGHASSHAKGKSDAIAPADIRAMAFAIYDRQKRNTDIFEYVDNHATNIPITSNPADNVKIWIDPDEEGEGGGGVDIPAQDTEPATGNYWLDTSAEGGTYYTAGEVDTLLQKKATPEYVDSAIQTAIQNTWEASY